MGVGLGVGARLLPTLASVLTVPATLSSPAGPLGCACILSLVSPLRQVDAPGIIRRSTVKRSTGSVDFGTVPGALQTSGYVAARLLMGGGYSPPPIVNLRWHDMPDARIGSAPALVTSRLPGLTSVDLNLGTLHNALGPR